jgi:uncharacterized membrane protein
MSGHARLRDRGAVLLLALVAFAAWTAYSFSRHSQYLTGAHDLGIFDQAIRSYARFQEPLVPVKGIDYNILGDHFHPILVLAAPAYWVWDDPRVLLVVQAVLLAASIPIVDAFARRRLSRGWALAVAAGYALGWPFASMVDFDFHEVAFAVPLLAAAIDALDRRSDRALVLWAAALLLVREDMGAVVMMIGLIRAARRPRALGVALVGLGALVLVVVTQVVIPAMSSKGQFVYWTFDALGPDPVSAVRTILTDPLLVARELVTPGEKVRTLAYLLLPLSLLPLGSPYALLAAPLLAQRLLNSREALWSTEFHYNAPIWIILVLAMVDAGGRWGVWRRPWLRGVVIGWLVASQAWLILGGHSPLSRMLDGRAWEPTRQSIARATAVSLIPPGVCVSVDDRVAPHLIRTNRVAVPGILAPEPDYVVLDLSQRTTGYPHSLSWVALKVAERSGYALVWADSSVYVLRRPVITPRDECRG